MLTLKLLDKRQRLAVFVVALLLISATAIVLYGVLGLGGARHADAMPVRAPADEVPGTFRPTKVQWDGLKIVPVKTMTFRTEQVTDGNIAVNDNTTSNVFSPYSGRVAKLYAKLGDWVKMGDPLMAVEASEFVQGQNDLITATGALNTARTQLKQAVNTESRQHELYLAKAGALKDWQQSESDLATAQNNLRTAEISLSAVRNRLRILGKSDAEITALETEPNAQRMKPEALVKAPISGTVVQRQIGLGQYLQSALGGATTPVFAISDLSTVWLIANLREADVPAVRVGQPVEVRVLAYPNRVFSAKVTWISPSVDPNTRRVPVRAEIQNHDKALKPMMFANFSIFTGEPVTAPAVPQSAVVYEGANAKIFVARDDGTIMARTILIGRQNNDMLEVAQGLSAGEKVVTSGALFIDRAAKAS